MKHVRFGKVTRAAQASQLRDGLTRTQELVVPDLTLWGLAGLLIGFLAAAIECW